MAMPASPFERPARGLVKPASAGDAITLDTPRVGPSASIRDVAQVMAAYAVETVFVLRRHEVLGVIDALDIIAAVRDAKATATLKTIMATPPVTIPVTATLREATEMLRRLRLRGLIVTEDERPIGTFGDREAVEARGVPGWATLEPVYEPAVCLPATLQLHAAAAQIVRLGVRRVVPCVAHEPVGIVSALDFVRYVAW